MELSLLLEVMGITVNVANKDRTLLLILPDSKEIYPLNSIALTQAQASRKELENDYKNAFLLDRNGDLRKIKKIYIHGPWGKSIFRKIISRLTDAWKISVQLSEPLEWKIERVKQLLTKCLIENLDKGFPEISDTVDKGQLVKKINDASNVEEIFSILNVPSPDEALDVL